MSVFDTAVWSELDPTVAVGGPTSGLSDDVKTGGLGVVGILPDTQVFHPDHPMFWFAGALVLAGTLIFTAHHVHVGADAGVGKFNIGADAGEEHK